MPETLQPPRLDDQLLQQPARQPAIWLPNTFVVCFLNISTQAPSPIAQAQPQLHGMGGYPSLLTLDFTGQRHVNSVADAERSFLMIIILLTLDYNQIII